MLNCVTSKLLFHCHGKTLLNLSNIRECVALFVCKTDFSTSSNQLIKSNETPGKWLSYNNVVYPPQEPGDERRPAVP